MQPDAARRAADHDLREQVRHAWSLADGDSERMQTVSTVDFASIAAFRGGLDELVARKNEILRELGDGDDDVARTMEELAGRVVLLLKRTADVVAVGVANSAERAARDAAPNLSDLRTRLQQSLELNMADGGTTRFLGQAAMATVDMALVRNAGGALNIAPSQATPPGFERLAHGNGTAALMRPAQNADPDDRDAARELLATSGMGITPTLQALSDSEQAKQRYAALLNAAATDLSADDAAGSIGALDAEDLRLANAANRARTAVHTVRSNAAALLTGLAGAASQMANALRTPVSGTDPLAALSAPQSHALPLEDSMLRTLRERSQALYVRGRTALASIVRYEALFSLRNARPYVRRQCVNTVYRCAFFLECVGGLVAEALAETGGAMVYGETDAERMDRVAVGIRALPRGSAVWAAFRTISQIDGVELNHGWMLYVRDLARSDPSCARCCPRRGRPTFGMRIDPPPGGPAAGEHREVLRPNRMADTIVERHAAQRRHFMRADEHEEAPRFVYAEQDGYRARDTVLTLAQSNERRTERLTEAYDLVAHATNVQEMTAQALHDLYAAYEALRQLHTDGAQWRNVAPGAVENMTGEQREAERNALRDEIVQRAGRYIMCPVCFNPRREAVVLTACSNAHPICVSFTLGHTTTSTTVLPEEDDDAQPFPVATPDVVGVVTSGRTLTSRDEMIIRRTAELVTSRMTTLLQRANLLPSQPRPPWRENVGPYARSPGTSLTLPAREWTIQDTWDHIAQAHRSRRLSVGERDRRLYGILLGQLGGDQVGNVETLAVETSIDAGESEPTGVTSEPTTNTMGAASQASLMPAIPPAGGDPSVLRPPDNARLLHGEGSREVPDRSTM
ncbi:unnamed protein product [Symbiodinium sp. CCMP2592]|nr:unnamed protein product [Symbiodinium sp. CCMP2592]